MTKVVRFSLTAAALSAAIGFAAASPARGQVSFQGNFPVPHGRIAVGVGDPYFQIDSFVPDAYVGEVYYLDGYGYGFDCDAGFVPVRRYANRWVVAQRPFFIQGRGSRGFAREDRFGGVARRDRAAAFRGRGDDRRFARGVDQGGRFDRRLDQGRRFDRGSDQGRRTDRRSDSGGRGRDQRRFGR